MCVCVTKWNPNTLFQKEDILNHNIPLIMSHKNAGQIFEHRSVLRRGEVKEAVCQGSGHALLTMDRRGSRSGDRERDGGVDPCYVSLRYRETKQEWKLWLTRYYTHTHTTRISTSTHTHTRTSTQHSAALCHYTAGL